MRLDEFNGQRVVVLGFGREGQSAWHALTERSKPSELLVWAEAGELPAALAGRVGPFDQRLADFDLAIRSPGIRVDHPALLAFRQRGGRVVNPSSIFLSERPDVPVIGITGSKGKSTTASLLAHLLKANGREVLLAGNIGVPLLDHLNTTADVIVAELSSYQLADLQGRLALGLITRLFPEHLDWHGSEQRYYDCKLRMADLLCASPLLINAADPILREATSAIPGRVLANQPPRYFRRDDDLIHGDKRVATLSELQLIGRHNLDNSALALEACEMLGCDPAISDRALRGFRPLIHRLEALGGGLAQRWINDSIATSPHATRAALESLRGKAVVLIAGGQARPAEWSPVVDWCRAYPLCGLITLPDNGPQVASALVAGQSVDASCVHHAQSIDEAVDLAASNYRSGETVLLSPGAPSFPRFKSFEERGERFRAAVELLQTEPESIRAGPGSP